MKEIIVLALASSVALGASDCDSIGYREIREFEEAFCVEIDPLKGVFSRKALGAVHKKAEQACLGRDYSGYGLVALSRVEPSPGCPSSSLEALVVRYRCHIIWDKCRH